MFNVPFKGEEINIDRVGIKMATLKEIIKELMKSKETTSDLNLGGVDTEALSAKEKEILNNAIKSGFINKDILEAYDILQKKIDEGNAKLKEQYDLEEEIIDLANLINNKAILADDLQSQINNLQAEYKAKEDELNHEYVMKKKAEVRRFEEENDQRKANLTAKIESVNAREDAVEAKEEYIADIEAKLATFEERVQEEFNARIEKELAAVNKKNAIEKNIVESKHKSEIEMKDKELALANAKIETLTSDLADERERTKAAYNQLTEVANTAAGKAINVSTTQSK